MAVVTDCQFPRRPERLNYVPLPPMQPQDQREPRHPAEQVGPLEKHGRTIRLELQGALQETDGGFVISQLSKRYAQQLHHIGIVGSDPQ
jgi:hypothetical protein